MAREFIILETKVRWCTAEAWINDVPVCRVDQGRRLDSRPVHEYMLPGRNRFTLIIQPGPIPSQSRVGPAAPSGSSKEAPAASVRLMAMPEGAFPEDPGVRELLRLESTPPTGLVTPLVLEREIEAPFPAIAGIWIDGSPFADAASLSLVAALLTDLRNSLNRGDPEPFLAASQVRFREVSIAYNLNVADELDRFRKKFQAASSEAGFNMQPIDPATIDLRTCGGGRLVDCLNRSWEPLLRSTKLPSGVTRLRYPVKIALIEGALSIVR